MQFPTEPIRWSSAGLEPIATGIEYGSDGLPCRIYPTARVPLRKKRADVVRFVAPAAAQHFQQRLFPEAP